jgi:hypothetical protein
LGLIVPSRQHDPVRALGEHMFVSKGVAHPPELVLRALDLRAEGRTIAWIAAELGVPTPTIGLWSRGVLPREVKRRLDGAPPTIPCARCGGLDHRESPDAPAYAYLLGVYLGDGCLHRHERTFSLSIACDSQYEGIIGEMRAAITVAIPGKRSSVWRRPDQQCSVIRSYGNAWACLFPQHGPGKKHHRRIALERWQQDLVDAEPGQFLRGLIQTDGWRGMNRVFVKGRWYAYPRYQFSSRSDDIRRLFTDACDAMGIAWRPWGKWHISVARREAVAKLDEFVGPKY